MSNIHTNLQYLSHIALCNRHTSEVPYDADADSIPVISRRMRTKGIPTTSFVNVAIFTNHKIVPNITQAFVVHVVVLDPTDNGRTRILVRAVSPGAPVVNNNKSNWRRRESYNRKWGPCTPSSSVDYSRTCY